MASKTYSAAQLEPLVLECVCSHVYQDRRYGQGRRLHTVSPNKGSQGVATCTVCGRQKVLQ